MKAIVSHDVDHITFWEHKKDMLVPKFFIRNFLELTYKQISMSEICGRSVNIMRNKWHNLEDLMTFNKENHIPATFFVGVSNGNGLSYSLQDAAFWIKKIEDEGFDVGVHGISYDNFKDIKKEYDTFKHLTGSDTFGVRMHYLRNSVNMLNFLGEAGYRFDTTLFKLDNPFKVGACWEFPLHIMDVNIIRLNARLQNQNLYETQETTKRFIDDAYNKGIKYLTVNFHDRFFNNSFKTWKEWYVWLIKYLRSNKFEFIGYHDAIKELESDLS